MASYTLITTFTDGTTIITSSERRPLRARSAAPEVMPIVATTVDDAVALSLYHDRFATTDAELAGILNVRLYGWGGLAALVAGALWALSRLL